MEENVQKLSSLYNGFIYPKSINCPGKGNRYPKTEFLGICLPKRFEKNLPISRDQERYPMTQRNASANNKKFPLIMGILVVFVAGVLLTVGGFTFAASQETHDSFCASCHTQPESTFFQRSTDTQPVDLASYHTTQQTECINCHSGQGVVGRVQAELMGARNALKWVTGTAVQPAPLIFPIGDQNCLKCHQDVTQRGFTAKESLTVPGRAGGGREEGHNNHWHEFLARWQAADPNAGTCVSCHSGHATDGNTQNGFMQDQTVQNECNACHQVLRREGGGG